MPMVYNFKTHVIVDRQKFDALVAELAKGREIVFVDNIVEFFSHANLKKAMTDFNNLLPVLLEKHEISLSDEDMQCLKEFQRVRSVIESTIATKKPTYPFMKLPEEWTFNVRLRITNNSIRRAGRWDNGYSLDIKTVKSIWDHAKVYWAKGTNPPIKNGIRVAGYDRSATFLKERISIGCQEVYRYEIEQLALHFGWEFP